MTPLETAARYVFREQWRKVLIVDYARNDVTLDTWLANDRLVPRLVWEELLGDLELERQYREGRRELH